MEKKLDSLENTKEGKKARSFIHPKWDALKKAEATAERLWDLLDTDFSTLKKECKVDHPRKLETLLRVMRGLDELNWAYSVIGGKVPYDTKYTRFDELR